MKNRWEQYLHIYFKKLASGQRLILKQYQIQFQNQNLERFRNWRTQDHYSLYLILKLLDLVSCHQECLNLFHDISYTCTTCTITDTINTSQTCFDSQTKSHASHYTDRCCGDGVWRSILNLCSTKDFYRARSWTGNRDSLRWNLCICPWIKKCCSSHTWGVVKLLEVAEYIKKLKYFLASQWSSIRFSCPFKCGYTHWLTEAVSW